MSTSKLDKYMPLIKIIKNYTFNRFKSDLIAGLTVGVMLVPQAMAYAMLAGLDPIYGLFAASVPLFAYVLLGTSAQLAIGPVAIISLLVATGLSPLAPPQSPTYYLLAVQLAFLVGMIQLLMGIFRFGYLVNFLSKPVISGFTTACAIIIAFGQLKTILGIPIQRSQSIFEIGQAAWQNTQHIHLPTVLISLSAVAIIIIGQKIHKSIPSFLIVIILASIAVVVATPEFLGVKTVGKIAAGLPPLSCPFSQWTHFQNLLPTALAISFIAFIESFAIAKAVETKPGKLQPNQDLKALGAANIAAGFFSGFPVTGGFARTLVNRDAGAQTTLSTLFSAVLVLATLFFLTPLFYYLPNAVLAAIILTAVWGLIDIQAAKEFWALDKRDFGIFVATLCATLVLGIEIGILSAVGLSLIMIVFHAAHPHIAILGKLPDSDLYADVTRFPQIQQRADILVIRMNARLFFANVNKLKKSTCLNAEKKGPDLKLIILNATGINDMDATGLSGLKEMIFLFQSQQIDFYIAGAIGPVRDILQKSNLLELIGKDSLLPSVHQAVQHFDSQQKKDKSTDKNKKEGLSCSSNN